MLDMRKPNTARGQGQQLTISTQSYQATQLKFESESNQILKLLNFKFQCVIDIQQYYFSVPIQYWQAYLSTKKEIKMVSNGESHGTNYYIYYQPQVQWEILNIFEVQNVRLVPSFVNIEFFSRQFQLVKLKNHP
eukprot:403333028